MVDVCGGIGAGKTTLLEKLSECGDFSIFYETVAENKYLGSFYQDKKRYALPMQLFLLIDRVVKFLRGNRSKKCVWDRNYMDDNCFRKLNKKYENISPEENAVYKAFYRRIDRLLLNHPTRPLMKTITFVYLVVPLPVMKLRIMERDRCAETTIDDKYHIGLAKEYGKMLTKASLLGASVHYIPYNLHNDPEQFKHAIDVITGAARPVVSVTAEDEAALMGILREMREYLMLVCDERGIPFYDPFENKA